MAIAIFGKDQQPFAGKAKGKTKKGKANMTEDPSATSTTADSTSWQGGDMRGVGTEDWGYYGEDWYQSGWHDSFTSYCVEQRVVGQDGPTRWYFTCT